VPVPHAPCFALLAYRARGRSSDCVHLLSMQ
jgi:hypothetical protein